MQSVGGLAQSEIDRFRRDLLDWYAVHARDLPWRRSADPYEVWVSEIMLQQTRVDQARPYFERFVARFPDIETLAASELDDVLLLWEGLGYYSRARNIHRAARRITEQFEGRFPSEMSEALKLAGVGSYTAAAVLSIAFGRPEAAVDGNVARVLSRYLDLHEPVDRASGGRLIREVAESLIDHRNPGSFNQAMMDVGATVCSPSSPRCGSCPLSENCRAYSAGSAEALPIVTKKKAAPHYDVAVGVVLNDDGEILLTRRPEGSLLGGLWEFPGARRREGESLREALRRGVADRAGLAVEPSRELLSVKHAFSHFKITMHAFACNVSDVAMVAEPGSPYRWVASCDMGAVALHRAARKIADHLASSQPPLRANPV
ncbi:MAG TPA: A/G-specific adenine glycosylase [Rhodothermales bacterium]